MKSESMVPVLPKPGCVTTGVRPRRIRTLVAVSCSASTAQPCATEALREGIRKASSEARVKQWQSTDPRRLHICPILHGPEQARRSFGDVSDSQLACDGAPVRCLKPHRQAFSFRADIVCLRMSIATRKRSNLTVPIIPIHSTKPNQPS